jgi:hypothetical protein
MACLKSSFPCIDGDDRFYNMENGERNYSQVVDSSFQHVYKTCWDKSD